MKDNKKNLQLNFRLAMDVSAHVSWIRHYTSCRWSFLFLLICDLQPQGILKNVLMANARPITVSIRRKDHNMSVCKSAG